MPRDRGEARCLRPVEGVCRLEPHSSHRTAPSCEARGRTRNQAVPGKPEAPAGGAKKGEARSQRRFAFRKRLRSRSALGSRLGLGLSLSLNERLAGSETENWKTRPLAIQTRIAGGTKVPRKPCTDRAKRESSHHAESRGRSLNSAAPRRAWRVGRRPAGARLG